MKRIRVEKCLGNRFLSVVALFCRIYSQSPLVRGIRLICMVAACGGLMLTGCQEHSAVIKRDFALGYLPISLSAGDVVRLTFVGAPEFNQTQKIKPDGTLNLPLVGEVFASGKRIADFQAELSQRYKSQLKNSEITVTLDSSGTPVLVSGAVNRPGRVVYERPITVLEAIMEAGGISEVGNPRRVHLIRVSDGSHRTQVFDLRPILNGKTSDAFYVKGGDLIYVEESLF